MSSVIDNIGLPYSGINLVTARLRRWARGRRYSGAPVGASPSTDKYVHDLRIKLAKEFPGVTFAFLPADIVSQILNFGLPAPIDIQVVGNDLEGNRRFADTLLQKVRYVPGTVDLRVQQPFDQPKLHINVDRTKAGKSGSPSAMLPPTFSSR